MSKLQAAAILAAATTTPHLRYRPSFPSKSRRHNRFNGVPSLPVERNIRNLAIIGFMGTGKTTVGHVVASLLNHRFVDTDELIEEKTGRRISEIFAADGEARFRQYEGVVVADLCRLSDVVISTGGGIGANAEHLAELKQHALAVCLWASPETILERIGHQVHRPLLRGPDPLAQIRALLAAREPVYRDADVLVNTEMRSMKEVAHQVYYQYRLARQDLTAG